MTKCAKCQKFLSPKGAARCAFCRGIYHRGCAEFSDDVEIPRGWLCPDCETKQSNIAGNGTPSGGSSEARTLTMGASLASPAFQQTQLMTEPPASPALQLGNESEVAALRRVLLEYMAEQRAFHDEMRDKLSCVVGRMDEFERRLVAIETREETAPQSDVVGELQQKVARLQMELSDRDQDALLSDLDIGHIPEARGENVVHTVTVLAAKLGVSLDPRDIVFAERVGAAERIGAGAAEGGAAARPRRIVVRLARRQLRDEILQAARVRRNFTSADAGLPGPPGRVYVNERLTRANRQLFQRVREECRKQLWRFAWTKRGRVYTRQAEGKQAYCIRLDADITRVFGSAAV